MIIKSFDVHVDLERADQLESKLNRELEKLQINDWSIQQLNFYKGGRHNECGRTVDIIGYIIIAKFEDDKDRE